MSIQLEGVIYSYIQWDPSLRTPPEIGHFSSKLTVLVGN